MDYQQQEENNYPKAFLATGIIMALLITLCYFIVISSPPPPELGTGGILVNYGTSPEGMGTDYMSTEEPSKAEHPNHTKPSKVTPARPTPQKTVTEQSDKKIVTQNTEDAPEVNNSAKKPNKAVSTEQPAKPAKPTLNQNALYKGKTNGASGEGDGTTGTPGNQGNPNGSTLTNNYNGTGSGNGGLQMAQRSFINKPSVNNAHRTEGTVVIDIIVDAQGNVTSAQAGRGTKMADGDLIQKCVDAVKNSKLNAPENAPLNQSGKVVFIFKVN